MSTPRPKKHPRFRNLRALISAWTEGQMSQAELDSALQAIEQGIGLSKRDKALGIALEQTGNEKDGPSYWNGFREGLVHGYDGAQREFEQHGKVRPVAELAAEAEAEAKAKAAN